MNHPVAMIESGTVKLERVLPGPIERVWSYIAESDKRARWLARGEFDLRVGGAIRLDFDNSTLSRERIPPAKRREGIAHFKGVITRLEAPRLLAHTWTWDGADTEVTYEIVPYGKGARLVIVHRRLEGRDLQVSVMGGWDVHTGILEDVLNGEEPRPFWSTHAKLEKEYEATL